MCLVGKFVFTRFKQISIFTPPLFQMDRFYWRHEHSLDLISSHRFRQLHEAVVDEPTKNGDFQNASGCAGFR